MKRLVPLLALCALSAAAGETVQIAVGALDSFAAPGATNSFGYWTAPDGAAAQLSTTNGSRRLSFLLKSGEALEYHPTPAENPENSTADVVVSNATMAVAAALPAKANPAHQASITAAKPAGEATAAYYGWAGAMTNGAPVWIRLAGVDPVGAGTEVDVGLSFDYTGDPATVSFRIGDAPLHAATNETQTAFPLATAKRKVNYLVFTGAGSIGDLSGLVAVFDLDATAVEPGADLLPKDGPGVEMTAAGFVVRFRTHEAGVEYELVASRALTASEEDWLAAAAAGAAKKSTDLAESEPNGELIELLAEVDPLEGAMFYKIRARR